MAESPAQKSQKECASGKMNGHATTHHPVERDQVMPTATSVLPHVIQ